MIAVLFFGTISFLNISDACLSRAVVTQPTRTTYDEVVATTTTTTPRPNITFPTYKCPPTYAAWYCLNEATCFTVKIGDEILYNCECANGYMGPRCEYKEIDGSYLPTRPRAMLEKASIASGATLALLFVFILCLTTYLRCQQKYNTKRMDEIDASGTGGGGGMDVVDGVVLKPEKRPFGPHHYRILPMITQLQHET